MKKEFETMDYLAIQNSCSREFNNQIVEFAERMSGQKLTRARKKVEKHYEIISSIFYSGFDGRVLSLMMGIFAGIFILLLTALIVVMHYDKRMAIMVLSLITGAEFGSWLIYSTVTLLHFLTFKANYNRTKRLYRKIKDIVDKKLATSLELIDTGFDMERFFFGFEDNESVKAKLAAA